ncbi:MAG: hypothetical protein JW814_11620 [Candidatus Krumholzibacteriota bacterium]|nr:hypothetical protein [Candidatus Krumholzibacteriota bacterium]
MRRIVGSIFTISLIMLLFVPGCKDSQSSAETGFELSTTNCVAIGIHVHIDDEYQGLASAEQPQFFALPAGTYHLYARSNASTSVVIDPLCWSMEISISDGNITEVVLDCTNTIPCED